MDWWTWLLSTIAWIVVTSVAVVHALLFKRDSRAAIGWLALILASPFLGAAVYAVLGINRVERKAIRMRGQLAVRQGPPRRTDAALREELGEELGELVPLARLVGRIHDRPLTAGGRVVLHDNGADAYEDMLGAIEGAQGSVALCSYIFDTDRTGQRFIEALADAVKRGVEVRVLVDGIGALYSFPTISGRLRAAGIPHARFLSSWMPWRMAYLNMRNHRKILICDGQIAFTGGLNIRDHYAEGVKGPPMRDLHARIEGPVVPQLMEVFASDWAFATGEELRDERWFCEPEVAGGALMRVVPDGPDADLDKIRQTLLGALAVARTSVRIVTPYFLPDAALAAALETAALRGVEVDVLLPLKNNLPYMAWATAHGLPPLARRGVRFWMTAPPFDHTKLMVVDEAWVLLGSANWDARSLRLNFEVDVEVYDRALAARCEALVRDRLRDAEALTLQHLEGRSLLARMRDGLARLGEPYL